MKRKMPHGGRKLCAGLLTLLLAAVPLTGCLPQRDFVEPPAATIAPLPSMTLVTPPAAETPAPLPTLLPTPTPTPAFLDADLVIAAEHPTLAALPLPNRTLMADTLRWLCAQPRPLGSAAEQAAADTIEDTLSALGYMVAQHTFDQTDYTRPAWRCELTLPGGDPLALEYIDGTPNCTLTAPLAWWDDSQPILYDMSGTIIVVPSYDHAAMLYSLSSAPPVAFIVQRYVGAEELSLRGLPVLHAKDEAAAATIRQAAQQGAAAAVLVDGALLEYTGRNIIAANPAATGDTYIVCAHYDAFEHSPGAIDNGSGTATLLEVARIFKKTRSTADIRFIFFTGEEGQMAGSRAYVNDLPPEELAGIKGVINLDMFGAALPPYLATAGGKSSHMSDTFLKICEDYRKNASAQLNTGLYFPPPGPPRSVANSDHDSFSAKGVSAIMFGQDINEDTYHTPNDRPEFVEYANLEAVGLWTLAFILNV